MVQMERMEQMEHRVFKVKPAQMAKTVQMEQMVSLALQPIMATVRTLSIARWNDQTGQMAQVQMERMEQMEHGLQGEAGADGQDGADGADGYSALISVDSNVGTNCFDGGTRLQTGVDNGDGGGVAGDGLLQDGEIDSVAYVCDGITPDPQGFVAIKGGTFTMGSPESENGRDSDETQHQVTLTSGFYMSDHEVTQAEWQALIDNNPSSYNNGTCDTCPVETVNWWEALHYANALSESVGLTACYVLSGCNGNAVGADKECTGVTLQDGSGNTVTTPYECEGYRLPTEAEREYAARAGTTTAFYNGDITEPTSSDPNANEIAWYRDNSGSTTHAVKGKTPNAWGLYDMSGNVFEWTWDWYGSYSGDVTDPTGPSSGSYRVRRGGSWFSYARDVRVAYRSFGARRPQLAAFRLARTLNPP